jgi:mono/diheme cytochrome c family protein
MRLYALVWLAALLLVAIGCSGNNPDVPATYQTSAGDVARGRVLIEHYDCGTCHVIPGVRAAHGVTASPLLWFSRRSFIAGEIPNTPVNLVRWLRDPRDVEPRTAMPAVGMTDDQARDIAAYLYTLR